MDGLFSMEDCNKMQILTVFEKHNVWIVLDAR